MEMTSERSAIAIFDEILQFMLSNPDAQQIIDFRLSDRLEQRLHNLLDENGESALPPDRKISAQFIINHRSHLAHNLRLRPSTCQIPSSPAIWR